MEREEVIQALIDHANEREQKRWKPDKIQHGPSEMVLIEAEKRIAELESELRAAKSELVMTEAERNMAKNCVCKGNWRHLVKECEGLIGKEFRHFPSGHLFRFLGLLWGNDDFYYVLEQKYWLSKTVLTSCVGTLKQSGFRLVEEVESEYSSSTNACKCDVEDGK